jgi:putative ABC transport system substrate-binding protein
MRYELNDREWAAIKPMLPNKPRGVPRVNDRRVLNGIFWVLRSGAPWRDLPDNFGPYTTCYNRFVRWRRAGVWAKIMSALAGAHDAVFTLGTDPVQEGFVASLNRPGGNITGISVLSADLVAKRLEVLHEFVPMAATVALLANSSGAIYESDTKATQAAADLLGLRLLVIDASSVAGVATAFAVAVDKKADALVVSGDAFFTDTRDQIVALAARYRVPAIYHAREYAIAGGFVSYGANLPDAFRQAGFYAGRILKGERPADLPVLQPTKFDLVINLKTAKALGLQVPATLLARADEVIE